jgi:hypothetical protein
VVSDAAISPADNQRYHKLENKSLRAAHGVPEHVTGILLTSVAPSAQPALAAGDVLTRIDGRRIADDGQVAGAASFSTPSASPRAARSVFVVSAICVRCVLAIARRRWCAVPSPRRRPSDHRGRRCLVRRIRHHRKQKKRL